MVGRICPLGWDRVKVSENLGAAVVAPGGHTGRPCGYIPELLIKLGETKVSFFWGENFTFLSTLFTVTLC